jgi:hypothetical protein
MVNSSILYGFLPMFLVLSASGCGSSSDESSPSAQKTSPPADDGFVVAPEGAQRVTLALDDFELAPGAEIYKCQNFANPFGRDMAIVQSQSTMSHGSHHLAVFRVDENADGELEGCSGLEFHSTLHAAQTPTALTQYPADVGNFHRGTDGIRLNAHYLNLSEDTIHPKIEIALDYVDADAVKYKAAQIYMNDSTLDIPPGRGSAGGALSIPPEAGDIHLISAQSHMHRRAVAFQATLADGTALYHSTTWSEPPVKLFDPEVPLHPGDSIAWKCDYENETSEHLVFGESADINEMCVLTGFYYPAPEGMTLVGDLGIGKMTLTR